MLTFKDGRTPALWQRALETAEKGRTVRNRLPDGTVQTFRWAVMLEHGAHTVHAVICREKPPDGDEALWARLTDHRPLPEQRRIRTTRHPVHQSARRLRRPHTDPLRRPDLDPDRRTSAPVPLAADNLPKSEPGGNSGESLHPKIVGESATSPQQRQPEK